MTGDLMTLSDSASEKPLQSKGREVTRINQDQGSLIENTLGTAVSGQKQWLTLYSIKEVYGMRRECESAQ